MPSAQKLCSHRNRCVTLQLLVFRSSLCSLQAREYVPPISASEAERIAAEYQAKLLRYRLLNRAKVRAPAFDMNQFTVPMQELAYSLAASIADDDELQSEIVPFLKPLDREILVYRESLLQAIVLEVLLARCHSEIVKDYSRYGNDRA